MESGFFENTGFRWGRKTVPHYASGVILLDIDALHRDFSPESLMKEAEKKGQMCSVQELLYSLCGDRVCFLAARWSRDWIDSDLNTAHYDCSEASEHPAAICFSGSVKPWHMEGRIRQTSRYFWKYADVCPLGEAIRLMYREDCRRAVRNYAKQCKRYLRLLILSKITWGDTRKFYKEQTESARCCIKTTLEIMNKER